MTSDEFLQEVLASPICPPNFGEIYKKFQFYQELAGDTLREFHRVCEKNNISYQLTYGSLLGAIRDNGQIPWDYDIDVFVAAEDRERLVEALNRDLDPKYYFYCPEANRNCRHVIMRLTPAGYRSEVLHVDVFYLVGLPEENPDPFIHDIKAIAGKRYDRLVKFRDERTGFKNFVRKFVYKALALNYNVEKKYKEYLNMCKENPVSGSEKCISADVFADWYTFHSEDMLQTKLYRSGLGELRIPVNYEKILSIFYGNYMEILPLDKRLEELMDSYHRLERFAEM